VIQVNDIVQIDVFNGSGDLVDTHC
jgi:hypothetical protein